MPNACVRFSPVRSPHSCSHQQPLRPCRPQTLRQPDPWTAVFRFIDGVLGHFQIRGGLKIEPILRRLTRAQQTHRDKGIQQQFQRLRMNADTGSNLEERFSLPLSRQKAHPA